VYAVAIGEPSFGIAAPLAVGLSLLVSVEAGGNFRGGLWSADTFLQVPLPGGGGRGGGDE